MRLRSRRPAFPSASSSASVPMLFSTAAFPARPRPALGRSLSQSPTLSIMYFGVVAIATRQAARPLKSSLLPTPEVQRKRAVTRRGGWGRVEEWNGGHRQDRLQGGADVFAAATRTRVGAATLGAGSTSRSPEEAPDRNLGAQLPLQRFQATEARLGQQAGSLSRREISFGGACAGRAPGRV